MARRSGYGAGSIRRRLNQTWELRWYGSNGKRQSKYLPATTTRREASRALSRILQAVERGVPVGSAAQTLEGFSARWLAEVAPHQLRPRTLERYEGIVRLHIAPSIGSIRLDKLSPDHVAKLHADCLRSMSPSSVRSVHACLRSILRTALERRLIEHNPADAVHPPKASTMPMQSLTAEQANALLTAADDEPLGTLYVLALTTGMRLGELLGLRWRDIDMDAGRLSVQVALIRTGKAWYLAEPKTDHSRRNISLPQRAVRSLRAHATGQKRQRLEAGAAWEDHALVFTNQWGEPLNGAHVTERLFKPLLRRAGLPAIRFHDLRHTAATIMLLQGINPRLVAERLGHSGVAITLDRYSHVLPSMQAMVADKLDEVFGS
jgi:integrase